MLKRIEHVGIVVEDLAAATEFFVELATQRPSTAPRPAALVRELGVALRNGRMASRTSRWRR